MSPDILRDPRFWSTLTRFDEDLLHEARTGRCPACGGRLDRGDYRRKPRGALVVLDEKQRRRFSLCCAADGCRKRLTPPSVRFLGRKVFLGAVVVLVSALTQGVTEKRAAKLRDLFGVSARTVDRWRRWWRETFVQGWFWRQARGRFSPAVKEGDLPGSLLDRFVARRGLDRLMLILKFLSPITMRAGP